MRKLFVILKTFNIEQFSSGEQKRYAIIFFETIVAKVCVSNIAYYKIN